MYCDLDTDDAREIEMGDVRGVEVESKGEVRIGYLFPLVDHPHSSSSDHDSSVSSVSHRHPS